MSEPNFVEWMGAVASGIAAIATSAASGFAWMAAKSARKQVELMRPRPLLLVEFEFYCIRGPHLFPPMVIVNLGSSPAIDVQVGPLTLDSVPVQERRVLLTQAIASLKPDASQDCNQWIENVGGQAQCGNSPAHFAEWLLPALLSPAQSRTEREVEGSIRFTTSYRALDGRSFSQMFRLKANSATRRVWIEAEGSLLDNNILSGRKRTNSNLRRLLDRLKGRFNKRHAAGTWT